MQSSAALVEKGYIAAASDEDRERLHAQLAASVPGAEFLNAFRVPRGSLHGVYEALRSSLGEQRGGTPPAERHLWHGTSWDTVPHIVRQGFNRSYAGRHGTLLGMATYFSADLAYSHRFCDRSGGGAERTKVVLLARVLVGNTCKGSSSDVEPPIMDIETGERYDSTVNREEDPSIFAVFRDFQAVPLFLVEFRT